VTKKIRINLDDPHTRAVWEAALAAKREVASWPAWKRGEDVKEHKMGYEFDESDRAAAEELFQKIRDLSANGPYHPGVTRPSYSAIETAAIKTLEAFAHKSGLRTYYDCVANVWFEQPNVTSDPAVWIGSHVDSVPQGGNYDGLAGVVAGLLCVRKLQQRGITPPRPVRAIALRGEESAWFGIPYIGAKAFLGKLTKEDLARSLRVQGHNSGEPLYEHMKNCGAIMDRVSRGVPAVEPERIAEYWELHIEQGPVLVDKKKPIGIVTDIRGNVRHANIRVVGRDGHSGTVPRELRADAVFAFAEFIMELDAGWATGIRHGHDCVVTCGIVETDSTVHGITRIPGSVRFCLEWRSHSADALSRFGQFINMTARSIGAKRGVSFVFDEPVLTQPAQLSYKLPVRTVQACTNLDLPYERMPSGAGHDAAVFSNAGVPTGMIFVRNENGSHNPDEAMDIDDFMRGVEVLYKVVTAKV
jgi:beta-ureidopropionase / N-carbamoyl-L-amino-acid hydrolase